jgi:hypothetical protein
MERHNMTLEGATDLARKIRVYWRAQGYQVRTWLEPIMHRRHGQMFCVRSDLVNGLPQRSENLPLAA